MFFASSERARLCSSVVYLFLDRLRKGSTTCLDVYTKLFSHCTRVRGPLSHERVASMTHRVLDIDGGGGVGVRMQEGAKTWRGIFQLLPYE